MKVQMDELQALLEESKARSKSAIIKRFFEKAKHAIFVRNEHGFLNLIIVSSEDSEDAGWHDRDSKRHNFVPISDDMKAKRLIATHLHDANISPQSDYHISGRVHVYLDGTLQALLKAYDGSYTPHVNQVLLELDQKRK